MELFSHTHPESHPGSESCLNMNTAFGGRVYVERGGTGGALRFAVQGPMNLDQGSPNPWPPHRVEKTPKCLTLSIGKWQVLGQESRGWKFPTRAEKS